MVTCTAGNVDQLEINDIDIYDSFNYNGLIEFDFGSFVGGWDGEHNNDRFVEILNTRAILSSKQYRSTEYIMMNLEANLADIQLTVKYPRHVAVSGIFGPWHVSEPHSY